MNWLVVCSKPQQEQRAEINLRRQIDCIAAVYCPRAWINGKIRSLFPSYLFVQVIDGKTSSISSTYGVRALLKLGGELSTISDDKVRDIKGQESQDGVITLNQYEPGQKLQWGNIPVIYQGMVDDDRCSVLFSMLGRTSHKILCPRDLSPVL